MHTEKNAVSTVQGMDEILVKYWIMKLVADEMFQYLHNENCGL
jgi:hypothetical protein